jgi:hypothetical protein
MFAVENHGTIVLVRPLTEDCRRWLHRMTNGQWFGGALCVEPRYVEQLVAGLINEGFAAQ